MPTSKRKEEGGTSSASTRLQGFTARFTPEAKDRLLALSQIRDQPAYLLIEEAFWEFWRKLPPGQREVAEQIAATVDAARLRFSVRGMKAGATEPEEGEPPPETG